MSDANSGSKPIMNVAGYPVSTDQTNYRASVMATPVPEIVTPAETAAITQIAAAVSSIIPRKVRIILYPTTALLSVAALALATSGQLHGVYETVAVIVGSVAAPFGSAIAMSHVPEKVAK